MVVRCVVVVCLVCRVVVSCGGVWCSGVFIVSSGGVV